MYKAPSEPLSEVASEKTSEETSEKIIAAIRVDNGITAQKMAEILGISSMAVEMQIAKLKQEGRLRRVGPRKGGSWEIIGDSF